MTSNDACAAIRVAVVGEWVPSQLSDVLALQRAEEPETATALMDVSAIEVGSELPGERFDVVFSTTACRWPGWECEPLWHDRLAVAVAKRSHLLIYPEVPCEEVLKQPLICVRSMVDEPWRTVVQRLFADALEACGQTVGIFGMAIALVSAGYGVTVAPASRLADYLRRGIAVRPLAEVPPIVTTYLLYPCVALTEPQTRFLRRVRSTSSVNHDSAS